ncbi:hypothetical protein ASPZODRAFT_61540 [Penicilliopsis zonata CBS 506.65]|uniref:SnoaL-like domain-containing protein n=1 Tax=Penicilliopsis zonata CBS 506.65 TaxID=1073090 RepID=A0A1L9SLT9_9EURO|nr:hypothetical protein ASPZODRAFT_61540 [Penicilliopsis zonata CBS 506.65]OJJ48160.1 hypothetical protein ASPZODRAFT_61540 [Penicilliopsis zonata CBS 506.65]
METFPRSTLLEPAQSLCNAFASSASLPTLLSHFTSNPLPVVHEHGLKGLAPFLGRSFTGIDGVARYFELIGQLLEIQDIRFDALDDWVVDPGSLVVMLRGYARFKWRETGQTWDETVCYRIGLAEEILKVQEYRVWADTGAAYLARVGRLEEVQEKEAQTRKEIDRRKSGCGDVIGGGLKYYGGCK